MKRSDIYLGDITCQALTHEESIVRMPQGALSMPTTEICVRYPWACGITQLSECILARHVGGN